MTIYMTATHVPDGSTVRVKVRRSQYEGRFQRHTLHVVTPGDALPIQGDTLLEVVRFPQEEMWTADTLAPSYNRLLTPAQHLQIVNQRYGPHLLAAPGPLRDWLATQPPQQVVGVAGRGYACPLARFLEAQGGEHVWVTLERTSVRLHGQDYVTLHSMWLISFLLEIDARGQETPISAKEALAIVKLLATSPQEDLHDTLSLVTE